MQPPSFFKIKVHNLNTSPTLNGLCACFEDKEWRGKQLISHLIKRHLVEFVFPPEEAQQINSENSVESACKAAHLIYSTQKYENRGELGELILHAIMKEIKHAMPLISKFYYKTHSNDTVKGFDSVHVLVDGGETQLWLGEVKFYTSISSAISDVVAELKDHFTSKYLRAEFMLIENKIKGHENEFNDIRKLINSANSLDDIKGSIHVPVFLTYESKTVGAHEKATQQYEAEIKAELERHHKTFCSKELPDDVNIHLILLPLKAKKVLIDEFDKKLKALQEL